MPSVTEIVSLLTANKYGDMNPSMLLKAQMRGTAVHELCEFIDYGDEPDEVDPELAPYIIAYKKFLRDYQPNWLHIEKVLACDGFAGTVDRIGMIDGHLVVVDLKTTVNMDRLSKLALISQIAGYALLYQLDTIDLSHSMGVQLKKDGTYTIHSYSEIVDKYGESGLYLFSRLLELTKIIRGNKKNGKTAKSTD